MLVVFCIHFSTLVWKLLIDNKLPNVSSWEQLTIFDSNSTLGPLHSCMNNFLSRMEKLWLTGSNRKSSRSGRFASPSVLPLGALFRKHQKHKQPRNNVMATVRAIATTPLFQTLHVSVPYQMCEPGTETSPKILCPERIIIFRLRSVHIQGIWERRAMGGKRLRYSALYVMYLTSGGAIRVIAVQRESAHGWESDTRLDLLHYIFLSALVGVAVDLQYLMSGVGVAVDPQYLMCGVGVAVDPQYLMCGVGVAVNLQYLMCGVEVAVNLQYLMCGVGVAVNLQYLTCGMGVAVDLQCLICWL